MIATPKSDTNPTAAEILKFVSVINQVRTFGEGQLDLRYIALHLSVTVFMLFATVKVLEARQGK